MYVRVLPYNRWCYLIGYHFRDTHARQRLACEGLEDKNLFVITVVGGSHPKLHQSLLGRKHRQYKHNLPSSAAL